jgi:hypothetical protein
VAQEISPRALSHAQAFWNTWEQKMCFLMSRPPWYERMSFKETSKVLGERLRLR